MWPFRKKVNVVQVVFSPQDDITALEIARIFGWSKPYLATVSQMKWDGLPDDLKRHFRPWIYRVETNDGEP